MSEIDYRKEYKRIELERVALVTRVAELEEELGMLAAELRDNLELDDRVAELERVLRDARAAIASLDDDALGRDIELGYPYKAELLDNIDAALGKQ